MLRPTSHDERLGFNLAIRFDAFEIVQPAGRVFWATFQGESPRLT
jgi:hypothetical protein